MSDELNDLFYTCTLVEFIGRKTQNKRAVIGTAIGSGFVQLLKDAHLNHCLSFDEVSDEVIEKYQIQPGNYDTVTDIGYPVPDEQSIGKLYAYMIQGLCEQDRWGEYLNEFFQSPVIEYLTDFRTALYIENPSYLIECVREGKLLA